jgi:hypothetical protein
VLRLSCYTLHVTKAEAQHNRIERAKQHNYYRAWAYKDINQHMEGVSQLERINISS